MLLDCSANRNSQSQSLAIVDRSFRSQRARYCCVATAQPINTGAAISLLMLLLVLRVLKNVVASQSQRSGRLNMISSSRSDRTFLRV
eukprot:2065430-Alexandrium_andersonii.AAC.2